MNRLHGQTKDTAPVRLAVARVHVPLSAVVAAWLGRRVAAVLTWLVRHPVGLLLLGATWLLVALAGRVGWSPFLLLGLVAVASLVAWRLLAAESFATQVTWRARGRWRASRVYRFGWQPATVTTGLAVNLNGREYLPRLLRVSSTGTVDRVWVRMLPGQVLDDWTTVAPRLAQTFGAQDCRVRTTRHRQQLQLWFLVADPLTATVAPFEPDPRPDLAGLPVAVGEDGLTYRLRLLGTHLLVIGATGAGKGSVVWSVLNAAGPAIRDRLVSVWCVDPKGGMELAPGRGLFARFVYGDPDDGDAHEAEFARVLEDAVAVMRRRQAALRGKTRLHTPSVAEPLIVVVVDELASLTAYVTDRDAKKRIAAALSLLLSQGRAVGVSVIGAVQDPRKEILTVRDLFPTRIALRLSEADHVGLVLGQGARDRGARCDQIPETLPGVGYVRIDGVAEPVRLRFSHITDDHITRMVDQYAPRATSAGEIGTGDGHIPASTRDGGWAA
jgi:S-DNA-T family DNA segregation ATPase FtsK/SpoIIIE